ncbi:DUF262 domain-containing protein [Novosphingobium aquiterrae]|uniref:DUF262 domain-containing protein n=1 Tax=Novosphingobium aquiterrae TaxID=624388 RepID=A0ABV6PDE2_9SPHN
MQITTNNYSISEIVGMIDRRELIINSDYQRGSGLWPEGPSSYFIDTILEEFPFPKIYLYEFMDRAERQLKRELVDGQQRIKTIQRYLNDEFAIRGFSRWAGMRFSQLDEETQDRFRAYTVSADVIRNARRSEILQMFRRMNAYTLPLNEAEKRHSSFQGAFKWSINDLSDDLSEFFQEYQVFTDRQIVRMADAELLADTILSIREGVVSTSPSILTNLYEKNNDDYLEREPDREKIRSSVEYIIENFADLRGSYLMKPYALHSLLTALIHKKYGIEAISRQFGVPTSNSFCADPRRANERLVELARAHEARERDGPFGIYVWGTAGGTNRAPRRMARVAAILRALGSEVPARIDADLA